MSENNNAIRMNPSGSIAPNAGQFRNPGPETAGNVSSVIGNSNAMPGPRLGTVRMGQPDPYFNTNMNDNKQVFRQQQNFQGPRFPQNVDQYRPLNNPNLQNENNKQRIGDPYQNQMNAERQRATMGQPQNQQFYTGSQPRYTGPPSQMRMPMQGQSPIQNQPLVQGQPSMQGQFSIQNQPQMQRQYPMSGQPSLSRQSSVSSMDPSKIQFSQNLTQNHNLSNQPNIKEISKETSEDNSAKVSSEEKHEKNLPQNLIRKSSNLNLSEPEKILQPEKQSKLENNIDKISTDKEKEISEPEIPKVEKKSNAEKENKRKTSVKGLIEDENIHSGTVHKNIKFFEEQDTAKTPLIPIQIISRKKEKTEGTLSKVTAIKTKNQGSESGVDETPMIHPNLRSIYEIPKKVAKMSLLKFGKTGKLKKGKSQNEKNKKFVRWNDGYLTSSQPNRNLSKNLRKNLNKKLKIQNFSPDEELLAFFYNSKKAHSKRDESNRIDQKGLTKNLQGKKSTLNGDISSPKKTPSKLPGPKTKNSSLSSPTKTPLKSPASQGAKSLPKTPESPLPPEPLIKKVPMNKIQVGAAPSPNLKAARSKVGSLMNTTHKPGGGNIRIENHKIDFSKTQSRIEAKNDQYVRSGGDKKIPQVKLQWEAKSKVGSLDNATYKPGGGEKKIETVKLDFREKAKSKVGSKDNVKHVPGGGAVKIESQKLEFKAQSKVGSLDNVKYKPGGGDVKIFDDKTYLKQISQNASEGRVSGTQSFGDLSVVREVEGRSAPATPGHKVVKIKKTTTVRSAGATPQLKNITEVTVASQNPKISPEKSSAKHEIKLTFSKTSPLNKISSSNRDAVEIVKTPAKDYAPVLKPSLSKTEANNSDDIYGKSFTQFINGTSAKSEISESSETWKEKKNLDNYKQSSESSDLRSGKLNLGNYSDPASKFMRDEMAAHEEVEKIWLERNNRDANEEREKQQKSNQEISYSTITRRGNQAPQYQPQTPFYKTEKLTESTVLQSFKSLHRVSALVFKNNTELLCKIKKEINDNYKKNKNVSDSKSVQELITYANNVAHEIKTTVAEVEKTSDGVYRLKLRPEMFEETENAQKIKD